MDFETGGRDKADGLTKHCKKKCLKGSRKLEHFFCYEEGKEESDLTHHEPTHLSI